MQNSKTNTILLVVLIILVIGFGTYLIDNKKSNQIEIPVGDTVYEKDNENSYIKDTYTYTNHGFSIELPKGTTSSEQEAEGGPYTIVWLTENISLYYLQNMTWWDKYDALSYKKITSEFIGSYDFVKYQQSDRYYYLYRQGNIGYLFTSKDGTSDFLKTFKFIGWPQVEGNKEDLVSFSIKPGQEVSGKTSFNGSIKGGYFFEGNFGLGALDANKKDFKIVYGITKEATSDWMTSGPVSIKGSIDFTNLPKGKAYIAITADDPRDASERGDSKIKQILIPVIIK